MPVKMPRSVMGTVPNTHGIVTKQNGLAVDGDLRKVVEPRKLLSQLASFFVVIAGERNDLPATNLFAVHQNPRLASDAEISQEIESVTGFHRGIQAFKDRLIHLLNISKRAIAVADYVVVSKMKICGEPYVRHKSL